MNKKIALLFSGGGAQYPGMMKDLYEHVPASRSVFELADREMGCRISDACFFGTREELGVTSTMIPAIFTADLAAYAAIAANGIEPDYMAGFSLGEWAAVAASGVLPFGQALRLVQLRAKAMVKATPIGGAGMAVILGKSNEYVEELCSRVKAGYVQPANYNYIGQVTVSGTNAGLAELEELANAEGVAYKRLPVDVPSHCELMMPARETLKKALDEVRFECPRQMLVPNATAEPTDEPEDIKRNIIDQLVKPVLFEHTMRKLLALGVDYFIELGPGKTLSGFARKIVRMLNTETIIQHVEDMESLQQTIEAVKI